jgi:hypothetical protein
MVDVATKEEKEKNKEEKKMDKEKKRLQKEMESSSSTSYTCDLVYTVDVYWRVN